MKRITILTGAGISAESGLQTFRDKDGLWEGHRVEEVATPEAFGRNPTLVHQFYNQRRRQLLTVEPNAAHRTLVDLEKIFKNKLTLITQNVDDLHERAGSLNPFHIHGRLLRKKCTWCEVTSECLEDIQQSDICEACSRSGGLRPDIVWFGENPYYMDHVSMALSNTDIFISIGTSGNVYPAARFVETASLHGAETIEVNIDSTATSSNFDRALIGNATETVPKLIEELIS